MVQLNENRFHLTMGTLLIASTLVDRVMRGIVPSWKPPEVTFVTLVLGLAWVALFAMHRLRLVHEQLRVHEDRLERAERKIGALEREHGPRVS